MQTAWGESQGREMGGKIVSQANFALQAWAGCSSKLWQQGETVPCPPQLCPILRRDSFGPGDFFLLASPLSEHSQVQVHKPLHLVLVVEGQELAQGQQQGLVQQLLWELQLLSQQWKRHLTAESLQLLLWATGGQQSSGTAQSS